MISLTDAIERAKLMAPDGQLPQASYNLLVDSLDEADRYAFTMALVDRGICTRTGKVDTTRAAFLKAAQGVMAPKPLAPRAPRFSPDEFESYFPNMSWSDADDEELDLAFEPDVPEAPQEAVDAPLAPEEALDTPEDVSGDIGAIRSVLEKAGISVTPEGKVNFYQTNVPGVYTQKLPQSLDLDLVVKFYNQILNSLDNEQAKAESAVVLLQNLEPGSVEKLRNLHYSDKTRLDDVRALALGLKDVISSLENKRVPRVDGLIEQFDKYLEKLTVKYDATLEVVDAISKLSDFRAMEPQKYDMIIQGLGGV